jgi:hypothetical protein
MSHRRTIRKGSFGDHIDELVKVLETPSAPEADEAKEEPKRRADHVSIHDRLFERAWQPRRAASQTSDGRNVRR